MANIARVQGKQFDTVGPFSTLEEITKAQSFSIKKQHLEYQDYRPLKKGDLGYSKTARRYISESTGDIISVRQFQNLAHGSTQQQRAKVRAIIGPSELTTLLALGKVGDNFKYESDKRKPRRDGQVYRTLTTLMEFSELQDTIRGLVRGESDTQINNLSSQLSKFTTVKFFVQVWHE